MEWCATSAERTSQADQRSEMLAAATTASPARRGWASPPWSHHHHRCLNLLRPRSFLAIVATVAPFCRLRTLPFMDDANIASNAQHWRAPPRPAPAQSEPGSAPPRRAPIVPRRSTRPRPYAAFVAQVFFPYRTLSLQQNSPRTHLRTGSERRPGRTYRATAMRCFSHSPCPVPASSPR